MEVSPTETSELRFLRACIEAKEATHDNSARLREKLTEDYPGIDHKKLWKNYLICKFIYLFHSENLDQAATLARKEADDLRLPGVDEFVAHWQEIKPAEERAFFYRLIQLPKESTYYWYDTTIHRVQDWCSQLEDRYDQLEASVKISQSRGAANLKNLAEKIKNDFAFIPSDHLFDSLTKQQTEYLTEAIVEKKRGFNEDLSCVSPVLTAPDLAKIEDPFLRLRDLLLNELTIELTKTLLNYGHDETIVIRTFLYKLKKLFNCDVVDYLDVEGKTEDESRLVFRVATLTYEQLSNEFKTEVDRDKMKPPEKDKETYPRGVGISGSVLLLDSAAGRNLWRYHIGSNDLRQDPRQSVAHLSAYQSHVYSKVLTGGEIKNFWIFPIYVDSKLKGAFRVVNKLAGEEEPQRIVEWSFLDRVQLAIIAAWFSSFLETLQPYIHSTEAWFAIVRREQAVKSLADQLKLPESKVVQSIITHLFKDMNKKVEKRGVGCCIILAKEPDKLLQRLQEFPLIDGDSIGIAYPYEGSIDKYHDAVNPLFGGYLLAEDGVFRAIVRFTRRQGKKDTLSPEEITSDVQDVICFLLKRESKKIHVYESGKRVADVFTSEYSSEWVLRFPDQIKQRIREFAPSNNRAIDMIADVCLALSNSNYGGIFVFGPREELKDALANKLEPRESNIKYRKGEQDVTKVGEGILIELAKIDGATFIDYDGTIVEINFVIGLKKEKEEEKEPPKLDEALADTATTSEKDLAPLTEGDPTPDVEKTIHLRKRGARHNAGMDVSRACPESLVIIVSENGGISLIRNGVPLELEL